MKFSEWLKLQEMPITAMHFLPKERWPEIPEPGQTPSKGPLHRYDKASVGILTSPKGREKIIKKWSNTKENFELYFVRSPQAHKFDSIGEVTEEWVRKNLGLEIETKEDTVTIIYTNNIASQKVPLTYWTIAHRLGHAIFNTYGWSQFDEHLHRGFKDILEQVYGVHVKLFSSQPIYRGDVGHPYSKVYTASESDDDLLLLARAVGTMGSVRNKQLRNYAEFAHELLAQYLMTGHVKFNPLPRVLGSSAFGRRTVYAKIPNEEMADHNEELESLARGCEYNLDVAVGDLQGRIFVM